MAFYDPILRLFTRRGKRTKPVAPAPTLALNSRYVLMNCINWKPELFSSLPYTYFTEATYFVLEVSALGNLLGENGPLESSFVINAHNAGKKATFSIAGGAQSIPNITEAVTRYSEVMITDIISHIQRYKYDGVTLDIENTNINPYTMVIFVNRLRERLDAVRPGFIIGCYIQPWQLNTVWSKVENCIGSLTWISPMLYDAGYYNKDFYTNHMRTLVNRVGKSKALVGLAVNYPAADGGLDTVQYGEMLDVMNTEGWLGVGLWQNAIFTDPYRQVQTSKIIPL